MKIYTYLLLSFLLIGLIACKTTPNEKIAESEPVTVTPSTTPQPPDPNRFTKQIDAFDRQEFQAGSILFVGSSSIRKWETLAEDLAPIPVINRGFGGSSMTDLLHHFDRLVAKYKPKAIFVYEGDNDLTWSEPEPIFATIKEFHVKVQASLPGTNIYFISIKPSVARVNLLEKLKITNLMVKEFADQTPHFHYVDVATGMMVDENTIRSDIFIEDNLHMNAAGYEIWTEVIKPIAEGAFAGD